MNCSKCGTTNSPGSRYCINCGNDLAGGSVLNPNLNPNSNQLNNLMNPYNNQDAISHKRYYDSDLMTCLMFFWSMLTKPMTTYNDEKNWFDDAKMSITMTVVLTIIMTLSDLIKNIISVIRVPKYSYTNGYTYSWDFGLIKNVSFIKIIAQDLILFAGIILAVSIVFYIGSLIIKKQLGFIKSLTISATSLMPAILGIMVLSPLLGIIWSPLGTACLIIGFIYTIILLYELMNDELQLEKNRKIFFYLICFSILLTGGFYTYTRIIMNSISSIVGSL